MFAAILFVLLEALTHFKIQINASKPTFFSSLSDVAMTLTSVPDVAKACVIVCKSHGINKRNDI